MALKIEIEIPRTRLDEKTKKHVPSYILKLRSLVRYLKFQLFYYLIHVVLATHVLISSFNFFTFPYVNVEIYKKKGDPRKKIVE
jgi:hypothetical protein